MFLKPCLGFMCRYFNQLVKIWCVFSNHTHTHIHEHRRPGCAQCGQSTILFAHWEAGRQILHKNLISGVVAHALQHPQRNLVLLIGLSLKVRTKWLRWLPEGEQTAAEKLEIYRIISYFKKDAAWCQRVKELDGNMTVELRQLMFL